jgi:hypothetical protein
MAASDTDNTSVDSSRQYDAPEYTLPANREKYFALCRDLGIFDQERTIFDNLVEYVQKRKSNPVVGFTEFCAYLQNKSLPGLTLDVNISTYTMKFVQTLLKTHHCILLEGDENAPGKFLLTDGRSSMGSGVSAGEILQYNEKVKGLIEDVYHNINETTKVDIPFPTQLIVEEKAKEILGLKPSDLAPIWQKGTQSIKVDDFTSDFIDQTAGQTNIIRIDFDEENHILLTPESGKGLFQSVLAKKISMYVQDNPDIQDRIKVVLKKSQKEVPDIHNIFSDIGTETSFFWILTFKRIMEYLYQHKKTHSIYLHYFEAASLLYQYSLNKRQENQKEIEARQKREMFREELLKEMINDYMEPWTADRIVQWHARLPKPLLDEKLSHALAVDLLTGSAPPPADDAIPSVMTIHTKEGQFFVHKFRFGQFFLAQNQKEHERLVQFYVQKWSAKPESFSNPAAFDTDIQDHLSDLHYVLLYKTVPSVFSHQNTFQKLFPDMVTIKNSRLHETDLADPAKHKLIFTTLSDTLFVKKYSLEMKPLHALLGLDEKTLHKMAKEYAERNVPFWKRGIIGFFFRWFFELLENMSVREEVRTAILTAPSTEDLEILEQKFRALPGQAAIKSLFDRRRQELLAQKRQQGEKEKEEERKDAAEEKKKREERIAQLKVYFIGSSTPEARLAEYAKEWNTKIGPARQETENNVINAIRVVMQRVKRFKLTKEEIETLADRVTADPTFAEIKNKASFKKYIALVIFTRLIKKPTS